MATSFWTNLKAEIINDRALYAVAGLYFIFAISLATLIGKIDFFVPLVYMKFLPVAVTSTAALYLLLYEIPRNFFLGSRNPASEALKSLMEISLPRVCAGVLLSACAFLFLGVFTSIKNMLPAITPFWADPLLAKIDFGSVRQGGVILGVA